MNASNYLKSSSQYTKQRTNDEGFTLLEIVIAMGLLLILSSVGVMTIRGINERTMKTAADSAVREVYNAAVAKRADGNSKTEPKDAATEYNNSQTPNRKGNIPIETTVKELPGNRIRVMAFYDGGQAYAVFETPVSGDGSGGSGGTGGGGAIVPIIEDTITELTYKCTETTSNNHLPIYNLEEGTNVSLIGSDGSSKLVRYQKPNLTAIESNYSNIDFTADTGWADVSEPLTMNAGITYKVKVYGKFSNFSAINVQYDDNTTGQNMSFKDCLVSVDRLGKHSGITTMNYIGGRNLRTLPESIPSSISSLAAVFYSSSYMNDPNVAKWDTSNITGRGFDHSFVAADYFNQDLSNWDISNSTSLTSMFYSANRFNNGGKPLNWDTSNITSLSSTFRSALAFNQNLDTRYDSKTGATYWDVSRVSNMARAFHDAHSFNNGNAPGVSKPMKWDTSYVSNMGYMFYKAESFNANLRRTTMSYGGYESWNTNRVVYMHYMFSGATEFNSSVSNWVTNSLQRMEYMFDGASSYNSPMDSGSYWNVSKVTNMRATFRNAASFNRDLSSWNVGKVKSYHESFAEGARFQNNTDYHPDWVA